jgi:hypothetical protein
MLVHVTFETPIADNLTEWYGPYDDIVDVVIAVRTAGQTVIVRQITAEQLALLKARD